MIEVVIQATDPVTGMRYTQQVVTLPFADPPVKRKALKRLAAAVEAWDVAYCAHFAGEPGIGTAGAHLHDAYEAYVDAKQPKPDTSDPRNGSARDLAHASATEPSPALTAGPTHLRPWRPGGLTADRTLGEVMLRKNGSYIDLWVRVDGVARWVSLLGRDVMDFLRTEKREAVLAVESGGFPPEADR